MQGKHFQSLTDYALVKARWSVIYSMEAVNQEPFPDFDLEINKEDKDQDIEHPKIRKNQEDEEKKDDSKTNPPPSK